MSRKKQQLVSLYAALREYKAIKDLSIEKTNSDKYKDSEFTIEDGDLISGSFIHENMKFKFFDRCSKDFGLHRLSIPFKTHIADEHRSDLADEINNFNLYRVGVKAVVNIKKDGDCIIYFNIETMSNGEASVVDSHSIGLYLQILKSVPSQILELTKSWRK